MSRKQVVSLAILAALAMTAGQAHAAEATASTQTVVTQQEAAPVQLDELRPGDLGVMNQLIKELEKKAPYTGYPLPYAPHNGTLDSIPDARTVGYGDCKSLSVAFRNMLAERLGYHRENMLLAWGKNDMGDLHMVLLIRVMDQGREQIYVYDNRFDRPILLRALTGRGFEFHMREEVANGRLVKWNGHPFV